MTLPMVYNDYEGREMVLSDVTRSTLNVSAERPRPAVRSVMTNRPFKPPGPAMLWCAEDRAEDDEKNGFDDWGDLCNDTTAGLYNTVDGGEDWEATKAATADSPSSSPPCPSACIEPQEKRRSEEEARSAHNPFARRKVAPGNEMVVEVLGASSQYHSTSHPINTSAMLEQVLRPGNGENGAGPGLGAARRVINHRPSRVVPIFQPPRLEPVHSLSEQNLQKPSGCYNPPATKEVHQDHVHHQELPSHDSSSLVIDLSSIDEQPGLRKPICAIFDVQPGHKIPEESTIVGQAPEESDDFSGDAWWLRLPDFVPVSVLQARGCNPRDGSTVYIQYKDQFSGAKKVSQIKNTPKSPKSSNKKIHKVSTVSTDFEQHSSQVEHCQTRCGHWITVNGRKLYVNAAGKHLSGRQAYTAARKEKGGKVSKASNPKRGRRK